MARIKRIGFDERVERKLYLRGRGIYGFLFSRSLKYSRVLFIPSLRGTIGLYPKCFFAFSMEKVLVTPALATLSK
jgi:hypothetical protein